LNQQKVHAAFDQGARMLLVGFQHLFIADVTKRWHLRAGADGSGNKTRLVFRRELRRDILRKLGSSHVDFSEAVTPSEFVTYNAHAAECGRFDHIATDPEKIRMNVANDVWPAEVQDFAAVFFAPEII